MSDAPSLFPRGEEEGEGRRGKEANKEEKEKEKLLRIQATPSSAAFRPSRGRCDRHGELPEDREDRRGDVRGRLQGQGQADRTAGGAQEDQAGDVSSKAANSATIARA